MARCLENHPVVEVGSIPPEVLKEVHPVVPVSIQVVHLDRPVPLDHPVLLDHLVPYDLRSSCLADLCFVSSGLEVCCCRNRGRGLGLGRVLPTLLLARSLGLDCGSPDLDQSLESGHHRLRRAHFQDPSGVWVRLVGC